MLQLTILLSLMIVVVVHEYGHYYLAKKYGATVPVFSIFMGREIFGFDSNGTRFKFGWIPIGGYIQMDEDSLSSLMRKERIKIALAGPGANLLLCVACALIAIATGHVPRAFAEMSTPTLLLLATVGVTILFIGFVPYSLYLIGSWFFSPLESLSKDAAGPIGLLSGTALPENFLAGYPFGYVLLVLTFVLSLCIGTFNLLPISILDGGSVVRDLLKDHDRIRKVWQVSGNALLLFILIYLTIGDLLRFF